MLKLAVPPGPQRTSQALARMVWRLPENAIIAVVGGVTLVSPFVPLFAKTYSAGELVGQAAGG